MFTIIQIMAFSLHPHSWNKICLEDCQLHSVTWKIYCFTKWLANVFLSHNLFLLLLVSGNYLWPRLFCYFC